MIRRPRQTRKSNAACCECQAQCVFVLRVMVSVAETCALLLRDSAHATSFPFVGVPKDVRRCVRLVLGVSWHQGFCRQVAGLPGALQLQVRIDRLGFVDGAPSAVVSGGTEDSRATWKRMSRSNSMSVLEREAEKLKLRQQKPQCSSHRWRPQVRTLCASDYREHTRVPFMHAGLRVWNT